MTITARGWHGESTRHSLAARGVKTNRSRGRKKDGGSFGSTPWRRRKAREIGEEFAKRFSSMDALTQYGRDEAFRRIESISAGFGTRDHEELMEEFYDAFEKAPRLQVPRTRNEIKAALLRLIGEGNTDARDIDAALFEVDYNDELAELVTEGRIRHVPGYYSSYYLR
jgi:hypothetical protein